MRRHTLNTGALAVESSGTALADAEACVCDDPPCICTAGEDCITTQ